MAAYLVAICHHKPEEEAYRRYLEKAGPTLKKYGAKILSFYGQHEDVESAPTQSAVLVEFADFQKAQQWYHSAEYQEAIKHREKTGNYTILLVDGV